MRPFLRFPIIYIELLEQSDSLFFITSMKSWMFEYWLHTYFVSFNILPWNTTTHSIKDLFWMYFCIVFIAVICIPIKSQQSNQTRSATWQILRSCKYSSYLIPFYYLQYMYVHNLFRLRTNYTHNIGIPQQN